MFFGNNLNTLLTIITGKQLFTQLNVIVLHKRMLHRDVIAKIEKR